MNGVSFYKTTKYLVPACVCFYNVNPPQCSIAGRCPLHEMYFSLQTTCANRGGNHKWQEESATGWREAEKGFIEGKRARGRKGWQPSASWELSLLARLNHSLWVQENTHAGPFYNDCPPLTPPPLLIPLFYSSVHSLHPASQFSSTPIFPLLWHLSSHSTLPFLGPNTQWSQYFFPKVALLGCYCFFMWVHSCLL